MSSRPRVLLVAPTLALARNLFVWLTEGGYDVTLATSFAVAKAQLPTMPHLVVSEVRLGEYNGLHLASRARACGIPSVVVGEPERVLERDARQMGIAYIHPDVDEEFVRALADHLTVDVADRNVRVTPTPGPAPNVAFVSSGELANVRAQGRRH